MSSHNMICPTLKLGSAKSLRPIVKYLEQEVTLPVNKEKSEVAKIIDVPFLGFQILRGKIRASDNARSKLKDKVRKLTWRNNPLSMYQIIQDLNEYLMGWLTHFRVKEFRRHLSRDLDGRMRSCLKSIQLKKWKKPRKFQRIRLNQALSPRKLEGSGSR